MLAKPIGVRLPICDSLSLATVLLLTDLGAGALESQIANLTPFTGFSSQRQG